MIRQLICAKYMAMKLDKYKRLVQKVEHADWLKQAVSHGMIIRKYFPHANDGALSASGQMGWFTNHGFAFSCKEFAVEYRAVRVDEEGFKWPGLGESASSKRFLLKHISERNRITWRLMSIIAERQRRFIQSGEPLSLRTLPYRRIIDDYKALYPNDFMDASIISRVMKNKPVLLPGGEAVSLHYLLPGKSYIVGMRLKAIMSCEKEALTDTQLRDELSKQFAMGYSTRYVAYCRHRQGIPPARYRESNDPKPLFSLADLFLWLRQNFIRLRRVQVCMN